MNEKYLWELWEKCKHPHPKYGGGDMVWPMEFAELIERECIEVCTSRVGNSDYNTGRMHCASDLKEHFGVEG